MIVIFFCTWKCNGKNLTFFVSVSLLIKSFHFKDHTFVFVLVFVAHTYIQPMEMLLALIIATIILTHINAASYKTIPTSFHVLASSYANNGDDDISSAQCPISKPTMVYCGVKSAGTSHAIDGSHINGGTGVCNAVNGYSNNDGVKASALCQSSEYSCVYVDGPRSGGADGSQSTGMDLYALQKFKNF